MKQPLPSLVVFVLASLLGVSSLFAQVNVTKGLGIQGYDPVAYFSAGKAIKGDKAIATTHGGAAYQFSSEANKAKFQKSPSSYLPEYGGYCAYALAKGKGKVGINPKRFKIVENKLYLFYDKIPYGDTLKKWNKVGDDRGQIKKADQRWAQVKD